MAITHNQGILNFSNSAHPTPQVANQSLMQETSTLGGSTHLLPPTLHLSPAVFDGPIPGFGNEPVSIESLACRYPVVAQALKQRDNVSQQLLRTTEHINNMYDELRQLRNENKELQERISALATSPTAELVRVLLHSSKKPAKRPEELPFSILWSFEDARSDEDAKPSTTNPSRPVSDMILRQLDGRVIPPEEYKKANAAVIVAYRTHLEKITGPIPGRPATLQWLRTNHQKEVDAALDHIEAEVVQAGWCSHRWKAIHLLQNHIQNRCNNAGKQSRKKGPGASSVQTSEAPIDPAPIVDALLDNRAAELVPAQPEILSQDADANPGGKRKASQGEDDAGLDVEHDGGQDEPPTKKSKKSPGGSSGRGANLASFNSSLNLGGVRTGIQNPAPDSKVSISHIRVDASYENVSAVLLSPQYRDIEHIQDLLDCLKAIATNTESGEISKSSPADNVLTFLTRIENADPNSPEISEDDNNQQWGHHQFTAGNATISSVLVSWDNVGGVAVACRLLAAAIKTHRVAEVICLQRGIMVTGSLISFIYLSHLVKQLWELVKGMVDKDTMLLDDEAPDSSDPRTASRDEVGKMSIAEMNIWIEETSITKVSGKRYKKGDLLDLIMDSESIPTHDYVISILKKAKDARKKS